MNNICLRCKENFPSKGIHNRLCSPCAEEIQKYGKDFIEYPFKSPLTGNHRNDLTVLSVAGLVLL